ncbi:MAG: DciA family protein [Gammaproteobacteria bacterium]
MSMGSQQANTRVEGSLARIYQSLTLFSQLTDKVRSLVDQRLAAHLTVTGWDGETLRIALDQPALATRWRFQEPALLRLLARDGDDMANLRRIRLVILSPRAALASRRSPSRLDQAPTTALRDLAATETHGALRQALDRLAKAAENARRGS